MSDEFQHLEVTAKFAVRLATRTKTVVLGSIFIAVALAWLVLALMAASTVAVLPESVSGPGGWLIDWLHLPQLGSFASNFVELCLSQASAGATIPRFAALVLMWFLMSVAMMLPSAAPMIRTYCEIADTAARTGKYVVNPFVLVAGYLVVWIVAALLFAAATMFAQTVQPLSGAAAAAALAIAGLWQFSSLKEACLKKCRAPFSTLFARWTNRPVGVFRLGIGQALWCLGCCWALMLVMFVVGIMNLFWMALIGVFAIVEKNERGKAISRIAGTILLVWAATLLVVSI